MKLSICLVLAATTATLTHAKQRGECRNADIDPVCGSNGVTYSNLCELTAASCKSKEEITPVFNGECFIAQSNAVETVKPVSEPLSKPIDSSGVVRCPNICPMIFAPVCGSNGVTYGNGCLLGIAQCKSGGAITQASEGKCNGLSSESDCPGLCVKTFRPVCGSDGVTYTNSCFLDIASCHDPRTTLAHEGSCETVDESHETNDTLTGPREEIGVDSCPKGCPRIFKPVCGSNGVTYNNECVLEVASCENPTLHLTKVCPGACSTEQPHPNHL